MMSLDAAAKNAMHISMSGSMRLVIEGKEVALTTYHGQNDRKKIIADWHVKYGLSKEDFELFIKPQV